MSSFVTVSIIEVGPNFARRNKVRKKVKRDLLRIALMRKGLGRVWRIFKVKSGSNWPRVARMACSFLVLAGCRSSQKTYVLTGRILSKQPSLQQLIINNDDIPGFMPAMTMPYLVKDPDGFARVESSDLIRADVIMEKPNQFHLEHLVILGRSGAGASPARGARHVLMIGDKVPDVPLVNQDGKTLRFTEFKGKAVLLTFLYTRCPFPDYCPLLSRQFAAIQRDLANNPEDYKKTHLISISLDPSYDKPPVLREYGLAYVDHDPNGFQHWDFVSTTPEDLQKLVASFGLEYSNEDSQISHSMNTVLLAPDGTVANMWPGNEWKPNEVTDVTRRVVAHMESTDKHR